MLLKWVLRDSYVFQKKHGQMVRNFPLGAGYLHTRWTLVNKPKKETDWSMGVSETSGTPKRMVYNGKPY